MSADNWRMCPKCGICVCEEDVKAQRISAVEKAYGVVPKEEYDRLVEDIDSPHGYEECDTLREDYEVYSEDHTLYVYYSCSCEKCGFNFSFEKSVNMLDNDG